MSETIDWKARAESAERQVAAAREAISKIDDLVARALAEPGEDTATLVEVCTVIELLQDTAAAEAYETRIRAEAAADERCPARRQREGSKRRGMQSEYIAPEGYTWVCGACGKHGSDRTSIGDEACFLNAILCYSETNDMGRWVAVEGAERWPSGDYLGKLTATTATQRKTATENPDSKG